MKRKFLIAVFIGIILIAGLCYYVRPREEVSISCPEADIYADHLAKNLQNGYQLAEIVAVTVDTDVLKEYISVAADGNLWKKSIVIDQVEFNISCDDPACDLRVWDTIYRSSLTDNSPQNISWFVDVPKQLKRTEISNQNVSIGATAMVKSAGKVEYAREFSLSVSARIKCEYRDVFLRKHIVWLTADDISDIIPVMP